MYHGEGVELRETDRDVLVANVWISCDERAETRPFCLEVFREKSRGPNYDSLLGFDEGTMSTRSVVPGSPLSVSS